MGLLSSSITIEVAPAASSAASEDACEAEASERDEDVFLDFTGSVCIPVSLPSLSRKNKNEAQGSLHSARV